MPIKTSQIDKNFGVQEILVLEMHMKAGPVVGAALIFTLHLAVPFNIFASNLHLVGFIAHSKLFIVRPKFY